MVTANAEVVAGITAAATLIGATIVAVVTAITTSKRQERQLAAEAERQAAALAHDRELADIADLRTLIDRAASTLDKATKAVTTASSAIQIYLTFDVPQENKDKLIKGAEQEIDDTFPESVDLGARLRVRLGPTDPLSEAHREANDALGNMRTAVTYTVLGIAEGNEHVEEAKQIRDKFTAAYRRFVAAAVERAGVAKLTRP